MSKKPDQISKLKWVYISGAVSLFFLLLAILMIVFAPDITGAGITKSIYYIVLIPVGLASAAFLFGALRSSAKYSGKSSFGKLELTGPVVIFCLVVIGGFYFATPDSEFSLTIRTSIVNEPEKILSYGSLILDIGEQRLDKQINDNGEVTFAGVPSRYLGKSINIIPQIKGYKIKGSSSILIPDNRIIYLELEERRDSTLLRGRVINETGNPVDSVSIDIESGLASTITDENGLFSIIVPASKGETVLLTALKKGITGHREFITVPERGSIEVRFRTGL
jgi:hypothetical protein